MLLKDQKKIISTESAYFDDRVKQEQEEGDFYTYGAVVENYNRMMSMVGNIKNKRMLDLGCGNGWAAINYARKGAHVIGIDVSYESLKMALDTCRNKRLNKNVYFVVGSAETMPFKGKFDFIIGISILHHLCLNDAVRSVKASLKDGGVAYFMEPLTHNPLIRLYRIMTPKRRTPNEKPLTIEYIYGLRDIFSKVEIYGYDLFALLSFIFVPFKAYRLFLSSKKYLEKLDRSIFNAFPGFQRYCWGVIIKVKK